MTKFYKSLLSGIAIALAVPAISAQAQTWDADYVETTFDFTTFDNLKSYYPELPALDTWTASGDNKYYETESMTLSLNEVTIEAKKGTNSILAKNGPRFWYVTQDESTNFRLMSMCSFSLSIPEGYYIKSMRLDLTSASYLNNTSQLSAGTFEQDSENITLTWIAPENDNVNTLSFTAAGALYLKSIYVLAYKDGYDGPGPEVSDPQPEPILIEPGTSFEVESLTPLYVYTPDSEVPNYYLSVEDYDFNVFEDALIFATDPEGKNPVDLTPVMTSNNEYVYTGTNMDADTPYYVILKDEYGYFKVTLYLSEYIVPKTTPIVLGEPFTMSADSGDYTYLAEEGDYYLVTDSDINLIENGLVINYSGQNIFVSYLDITTVETEDGLVYNGLFLQSDETYVFQYSGNEELTLTLYKGTYSEAGGTIYMGNYATLADDKITLNDEEAKIALNYGQVIDLVADEDAIISIPVYFNGAESPKGLLGVSNIQVDGEVLYILAGASGLFNEVGSYYLEIPEGLVTNVDGAVNMSQDVIVSVVSDDNDDDESGDNPGGDNPGGDNPGGDNPGGDNPGGDNPGGDNPGEGGGTVGIAGVQADANGMFHVYTLQGANVVNGDANALRNLNKGLYIINGKKVVISK